MAEQTTSEQGTAQHGAVGRRICSVIPAAGRGSRLGLDTPKIALEIADRVTVWHLLDRCLRPWVAHLHVITSPAGESTFRHLADDSIRQGVVSVSVQDEPRGMGDAIFGAAQHWHAYDSVLVVWGDQVNVSPVTVGRVVLDHLRATSPTRPGLTIPLVPMPEPYVEYELTETGMVRVRMSREGDQCRPGGLSDVGVFCLSTTGLGRAWADYLAAAEGAAEAGAQPAAEAGAQRGAATGEVNFLPFLPHLSQVLGWPLTVVPVTNPGEARGINTIDDLKYARRAYLRCLK